MSETATIISAIAGVVVAIGGVVLAISRLGPFVNAVNKMLNDQHKRAMEAKSKAPIQAPVSTSAITDFPVRKVSLRWEGLIVLGAFVSMLMQLFLPLTALTVVTCTLNATGILTTILMLVMKIIVDRITLTFGSLPDRSTHS